MIGFLKYVIIVALFCAAPFVSHSAESPGDRGELLSKKERQDRDYRKKAFLSSILLGNIDGAITVPDTDNYLSTEGHTSYGLDFLRTADMRRSAVESVYNKYGFNTAVELKLKTFSTYKNSFRKRLFRSGKYIKTITEIFEEEDLPRELIFLPLIESQFNPYAYSRTRAAGPWQLMSSTARKLNLKIDWWVDERRDPIKSSKAAARYLKYLYNRFGSWNLALAAYNAGEGKISSVIRKTGSNDFWTIRKSRYLTRETKNYIPSYIAATAIAMNPGDFGFRDMRYQKPLRYDEAIIQNPMDLELVARFANVDVQKIRDLNPELKRLCTPPNVPNYTLRIPRGTKKLFFSNLSKTKGYEPYYVRFYTVRKGDTVKKIAMKLGSPVKAIIDMNNLGKRALIRAGKKIVLPFEGSWEKITSGAGI
jgi:membrane-bound lytic murein transglycosylase D